MAEFKRSRLERQAEEQITKKTVVLGLLTVILVIVLLVFGLPLLIKFSILLGEGKVKKSVEVEEKVLPPLAPRLVLPYEATNSATIKITGFAESKVTVELMKNQVSIGTTEVTENGDFEFDKIPLDEGKNEFTAVASTEKSGSGDDSKTITVVYDNEPPELLLTNPSEESLNIDYADFDIVGKTEPGCSVSINNRITTVDSEGNFKLKWQLNMGKNDLEITSTDLAGNSTKKKISITYSL
ncbi:MAG TPA: hypothetical protein PKZ92_00315 [Candidatus Woesebacteria bacterium]|jgi:hypothetical protein|nr:hypothetical protein [Candidatus Shapirobacteria bacterium]HOR01699.1 hypothetical protein [Candidatus Woesebacteria bacterium]